MDPELRPLEREGVVVPFGTAAADAVVLAAWQDHRDELYAFLVRVTHDRETTEDLLQDVFVRLTGEVRSGRSPGQVRPWLYRVASNLACSRGRRLAAAWRWTVRERSAARGREPGVAPESALLEGERTAELLRALDGLEPAARVALLLSGEGFSGDEIAATLGRSNSATRSLLYRARMHARRALEAQETVR